MGTVVINESYYGEYGCQAVNELGVASKSLQVSGEENICCIIFCRKHNNAEEICKPPGIGVCIISIVEIKIFTVNSSSLE